MEPYRTTMKAIIKKIGYYDIDIVELEISEDHIHMVIQSISKQSPSCGGKVILLKRLEMQMKKQLESMFKSSLLN